MLEITDIIASIESKELIKDDFAKNGTFETDSRNHLIRYTGGFTVVFPFTSNGEKWAFRCWHTNLGNQRERFEILSKTINQEKLPYLCNFFYVEEGICVGGETYPTTRMRWIIGKNIKEYICVNKEDKDKLILLSDKFLNLCKDMHMRGFAHGDLQHGNILVDEKDELFLIDYDSFYCPDLKGSDDIIAGLKDYQHPKRASNKIANEKIDYFSELIIYLSIVAIAEKPSLVDSYELEKSDRMLFTSNDFNDLQHSLIYLKLIQLSSKVQNLLKILALYLSKNSIDELESFDVLLAPPNIVSFEAEKKRIYKGDNVVLHWQVENCLSLSINGNSIPSTGVDYIDTNVTNDKTYQLEIDNGFEKVSKIIAISVLEKPIINVSLDKDRIRQNRNEIATLSWDIRNSFNAFLIDANGKQTKIPIKGSQKVSPKISTTYNFIVIGNDEMQKFTKSIKLSVSPVSEVSFTAARKFSYPSVPVRLEWNVKNADNVEFVGIGKVDFCGNADVYIDKQETFELIVTDKFGKKKYEISVRRLPLPVIKTIMPPSPNLVSRITIINKIPNINLNIHLNSFTHKLPNFKLKESNFNMALPNFVKLKPAKTVLLKSNVGLLDRMKIAYQIISNKIDKLKIEENEK